MFKKLHTWYDKEDSTDKGPDAWKTMHSNVKTFRRKDHTSYSRRLLNWRRFAHATCNKK